jgi:4-amino-4-deoxychorismate lyase
MSPLIESIRLENGKFFNLDYHQDRIDRSVFELTGSTNEINLENFLRQQNTPPKGLYKCRIVYKSAVDSIEFLKYTSRSITKLQTVVDDEIEYSYKFEDRKRIENLLAQRGAADDILIIRRNMITDSSHHNVIFFDGDRWVTPRDPLLKGTMRQKLLDQKIISESPIKVGDIDSFHKVKLINAIVRIDGPEIDVSKIVF